MTFKPWDHTEEEPFLHPHTYMQDELKRIGKYLVAMEQLIGQGGGASPTVTDKVVNYQAQASDDGNTLTWSGDQDGVFTLPSAVVGRSLTFVNLSAHRMTIVSGDDILFGDQEGTSTYTTAKGNWIRLTCCAAGTWVQLGAAGEWSTQ